MRLDENWIYALTAESGVFILLERGWDMTTAH